jgi:hypothetical protein
MALSEKQYITTRKPKIYKLKRDFFKNHLNSAINAPRSYNNNLIRYSIAPSSNYYAALTTNTLNKLHRFNLTKVNKKLYIKNSKKAVKNILVNISKLAISRKIRLNSRIYYRASRIINIRKRRFNLKVKRRLRRRYLLYRNNKLLAKKENKKFNILISKIKTKFNKVPGLFIDIAKRQNTLLAVKKVRILQYKKAATTINNSALLAFNSARIRKIKTIIIKKRRYKYFLFKIMAKAIHNKFKISPINFKLNREKFIKKILMRVKIVYGINIKSLKIRPILKAILSKCNSFSKKERKKRILYFIKSIKRIIYKCERIIKF